MTEEVWECEECVNEIGEDTVRRCPMCGVDLCNLCANDHIAECDSEIEALRTPRV